MKKTLLGAALTAAATNCAWAQTSSVQLYGIVDIGVISDKTEGQKARNAIDNALWTPSRFGLRGQEQLTSDSKAFFVLENGFAPDTGTATLGGRLFGRSAYVGIENRNWGELRAGRSMHFSQLWAPVIASPFILGMGRNSAGTTLAFDDDSFGNGRVDNAVYYVSPSFSGLQVGAGYSFNIGTALPGATATAEVPGTRNNNRLIDSAVRYTNGPLSAVVAYMRTQVADSATAQRDPSSLIAAASYNFGIARVHAAFGSLKNSQSEPSGRAVTTTGWLTAARNGDKAYSLGVSVPVGGGEIKASFQKTTSSKITSYGAGYFYSLSKRTALYAFWNDGETRDFVRNEDVSRRQLAVGVSHIF